MGDLKTGDLKMVSHLEVSNGMCKSKYHQK